MSNKTEQILNGLESPFLSNELFADESSVEASAFSSSVLDESPFLQGFAENFLAPASLEEQYYAEEFEDAQAFPEGDDEEQDEEWRDIEYDSTTTGSLVTPDSLLAIPAFTPAKRAIVGKLLTPAASRAAISWNAENHPRKSGVSPDSILGALQSYVGLSAVNDAIASYNSQNPKAPIKPGTVPVDAVFVEAIHQFQIKCYKDSKQHDGFAGPSVLDSLGFWPRKGLRSSAQTNEWAKGRVRSGRMGIEEALSTSTDLTKDLTQSNWWSSFVNPCFLGWGFVRPIHVYFARKLRKAELWLLSQSRFAGATPVELATLLEIDEKHAGGRSESGSKSIHTLGLGIDVKYKGNPHIGDYRDKPIGAKRFSEVMKRAAAKISRLTLADEKFPQYLNRLGTDTSKATGQIYDELIQRDQDLRKYLALAEARADLAALTKGVFKGRVDRDPLKGFLNLDRDLVIALRDHACLVWGAVDLGPSSSGDIMHFDCRLDDLGRAVYCGTGGAFNDKHPCWKRSEPPCPQSTGRSGRGRPRDDEVLDSECEDDSLAELEEIAEEESVAYPADADDAFTEEFEGEEFEDDTETSIEDFDDMNYELAEEAEVEPVGENQVAPRGSAPKPQRLKPEKLATHLASTKGKLFSVDLPHPQGGTTAVFVPDAALNSDPVTFFVWIHGNAGVCSGEGRNAVSYVQNPHFSLVKILADSGRPWVLVVPSMNWTGSNVHALQSPKAMNEFLERIRKSLVSVGWSSHPSVGRLVLAGHSRAYVVLDELAREAEVVDWYNDSLAKLTDVWSLDTMYARNSCAAEKWIGWAAIRRSTEFRVFYLADTKTAHEAERLGDKVGAASMKNIRVFKLNADADKNTNDHCLMPPRELPDLIARAAQ
jgi:hypothetical protein